MGEVVPVGEGEKKTSDSKKNKGGTKSGGADFQERICGHHSGRGEKQMPGRRITKGNQKGEAKKKTRGRKKIRQQKACQKKGKGSNGRPLNLGKKRVGGTAVHIPRGGGLGKEETGETSKASL